MQSWVTILDQVLNGSITQCSIWSQGHPKELAKPAWLMWFRNKLLLYEAAEILGCMVKQLVLITLANTPNKSQGL